MDLNTVLQLPEELLSFWHAHRLEVMITFGIVASAVRLALHWRSGRTKTSATPPIGTPVDEKTPLLIATPPPLLTVEHSFEEKTKGPKRIRGVKSPALRRSETEGIDCVQPYIFYFTIGGSTKEYALELQSNLAAAQPNGCVKSPEVHDLTQIDYDDFFVASPKHDLPRTASFYIFLIPSYNIDTELNRFLSHLDETHHDFRIDTAPLSGLAGYSVFGFGDRQEWPTEHEGFCSQAIEVDKWMARLTAGKRAYPVGMGDVNTDARQNITNWQRPVNELMAKICNGMEIDLWQGVPGSGDAAESGDEEEVVANGDMSSRPRKRRPVGDDLEDIKAPIPVDFTTVSPSAPSGPKAMVPTTSPTYASLTKQGYTIVGTHSGVKICRWTKSALRGRGSCYKYSFYGIASHLCMEATPSLSCSNKCVFCWRHGTNPVGTTWRWQVDPPEEIFAGMKAGHYKKIKMMRGVPGVRAERFEEAMRIRHCALSLVGEPIFYPHINELLAMLHKEHISSFLVCNAQHPDQLATLGPVTQLYVSIDASNKDSLRRIDRPLHRDFWERFIRCMDILREKRFTHRTVFRLTLVKGFNIEEEATGYADLVERALPGFVEIKGVTYCGTSTAAGAGLTMQNVPFYDEVKAFVLALEAELQRRGLDYGIAAEHAHSCCILLADRPRFQRRSLDGQERWHTLIDYAKFFQCLEAGEPFGPEDYVGAATPEWALWGNGGFDPRDQRVDRKGRPKVVEL